MKVEEVLITKGFLSKDAVRSAAQASDKTGVSRETLLLASGAISELKLKEALALDDEQLEEFKDRLLFLKKAPLFSQMDNGALREITRTASWEWFPRDHVIIRRGGKTADFYVIYSGRVRVSVGEGESETTLGVLSRGECFGEMSLLSGGVTTASVRAAEPTLCLRQGKREFLEMMNRYPTLHRFFSKLFVERITYKESLLDSYPFCQLTLSSSASQPGHQRPVIILTLGRFKVIRNGKPIVFVGKAQKKPLLLLKALICLGGKEVCVDAVTELLWPDSEGDAAHHAFGTTLARLRRLIGNQEAIRLSEGRVRINPDCVWTDVWEFDSLCKQADGSPSEKASNSLEKAIRLYEGHFLPSEDQFWAVSVRDNLRSRFAKLVLKLGDVLEQRDELKSAIECYEKALEIDEFVEEFYQRLMTCCQKRGCGAEAIAAYERCARVLRMEFGISPSSKTLSILQKSRAGIM